MWSIHLLPLLSGALSPGMFVLNGVALIDQTEIFNHFIHLKPFNYEQTNDS